MTLRLPTTLIIEMAIGPATYGFRPVKNAPVPIQGADQFGLQVGQHILVANYPKIVNDPQYAPYNTTEYTKDGGCRIVGLRLTEAPLKNPLPASASWGWSSQMTEDEWRALEMIDPYNQQWWIRWADLVPVAAEEVEAKMQIVVDCWEGTETLDTSLLLDAGVIGLLVRLNDMNGGHHLDQNFRAQWVDALEYPASTLYFVYNPWVNGRANADWLLRYAPVDTPQSFMIDFELQMPGKTAAQLTVEFSEFLSIVKPWRTPILYTAGFCMPFMTVWPKDIDYWWARYPYSIQGDGSKITTTWDVIRGKLETLGWNPDPTGKCPVPPKLWQCTSRYILPGTHGHPIDLNIWPGSVVEWQTWIGQSIPVEVTPEEQLRRLWAAHPELH